MIALHKNALLAMVLLGAVSVAAGCGEKDEGGEEGPTPTPTVDPSEPVSVQEARVQFPRFLDLQTNVLSSTCSPNPGVCHNSSNYPNLESAGNTLSYVNAPCNVEIPDPLQGWDSCERKADVLRATTFTSPISYLIHVGPGTWRIGFRTPAPVTATRRLQVYDAAGAVVLEPPQEWGVGIALVTGSNEAAVTVSGEGGDFIRDYVDSILETVIGGDPNRNGIWGADDPSVEQGALFFPGDPSRSYLWGRITETVPGSRMPLANAPITNPAYVAIACWIEGLQADGNNAAEDPIDYDACQFANAPIDYAIE